MKWCEILAEKEKQKKKQEFLELNDTISEVDSTGLWVKRTDRAKEGCHELENSQLNRNIQTKGHTHKKQPKLNRASEHLGQYVHISTLCNWDFRKKKRMMQRNYLKSEFQEF